MKPSIKFKNPTLFLILFAFGCFTFSPVMQGGGQSRPSPTPSTQDVNVVNTPNVNVVSTTASPVLVRDVDNPTAQPFQAQVMGGFADGASTTGDILITTVPAGKRLVIEHFSAFASMAIDQNVVRVGQEVWIDPFSTVILQYRWDTQGHNADGSSAYFVASESVRFYAYPGPIKVFAERDSFAGANPNSVTFTISGYLVNCPTCAP